MTKPGLLQRLKDFVFTPVSAQPQFGFSRIPRTDYNYAQEVGDGLGSSVLMSPVKFIQRTFPEAILEVSRNNNGKPEAVPDHALAALIARPNPYYTGTGLWAGTLFSYLTAGNGYWLKIRQSNSLAPWPTNVTGKVQELWYAPHWSIYPQWPFDGSVFVSHYRYFANGKSFDVAPENVVHFRCGVDPRNPRLGLSPIESELREIFADDEAANMMASLCRNMGVPGLIVSPDGDATAALTDVEAIKEQLRETTTGDRRGEPLVFRSATKVDQFGFDPKSMDISSVRDAAEARVCAALGIPPAVVGYESGMGHAKVGATMIELRKQAWEGGIIPIQNALSETLAVSLLPEFESKPAKFGVRFNTSNVAAMQQNQGEVIAWIDQAVRGGWLRVDHGQAEAGFTPDPTQAVYLRNAYTSEIPANSKVRPPSLNQPRNEPTVGASDIPKAFNRASTKAVNRFIRVQSNLEKSMVAQMAPLFDLEKENVLSAAKKQFDKQTLANGTWIRTAIDEDGGNWTGLFTNTTMDCMKAGWKLLGNDLGRNYGKARKQTEQKDPVASDSPIDDNSLGISFDIYEVRALDYARTQAALAIKQITDTTVGQIQSLVEHAIQEGWSVSTLTDEIESLYDGFSTIRAETIARTETASAINSGKYEAAKETQTTLGLQLQKTWTAVEDDRTRDTHAAADGQTVPIDDFYDVGGAFMRFPGDPLGPPAEVINCRCSDIMSEISD